MPDLLTLIAAYPELAGVTAQGIRRGFVPLTEVSGLVTSAYAVPYLSKDSCLVARRKDGNCTIPGGTIEPGESWEETLRRELLEETGASIERFEAVGAYRLVGESTTHRIFCWAEVVQDRQPDEPESEDHSIDEVIVVEPAKAPTLFRGEFAHLGSVYSLINDVYQSANRDKPHV